MRFLLSSLFLLLVGCASYPKKTGYQASNPEKAFITNPYFSNPEKDYVYKLNIEVYKEAFGGLLIIKKVGDDQHRIAFTTEMGNTLFDFSLNGNDLIIHKIIKDLDRKILINVLKRDFIALVTERIPSTKTFQKGTKTLQKGTILGKKHYYLFENDELLQILRTANGKEKVVFRFSGISNNIAQRIEIQHKNIQLHIKLKAL